MPPRSHTAIFWASRRSCLALPPWLAFIDWACPRPHVRPSWAHRSASQYQVNRHATATTRSWRYGAMAVSKISGMVGIFRWSMISPSRLKMQTVHRPGMQADAAVRFMHVGVKSQRTSSSSPTAVVVASIPDGSVEEEVSIIINALHALPDNSAPRASHLLYNGGSRAGGAWARDLCRPGYPLVATARRPR